MKARNLVALLALSFACYRSPIYDADVRWGLPIVHVSAVGMA